MITDYVQSVLTGSNSIETYSETLQEQDIDEVDVEIRRNQWYHTEFGKYYTPPLRGNQWALVARAPSQGIGARIGLENVYVESVGDTFYTEQDSGDYYREIDEQTEQAAQDALDEQLREWEHALECTGATVTVSRKPPVDVL